MVKGMEGKVKLWRERFYGRQDVYGWKNTFFNKKKGCMDTRYIPSFREGNREIRDAAEYQTPAEKFIPLDNKVIAEHIEGTKELMMYVLQPDRTIRMAAVDFDLQYSFDDVKRCAKIIKSFGVNCDIARSTTKGHHIYMFFEDFIEAKYFTSWLYVVYCQAGFVTRNETDGTPLPEVFPKTTSLGSPLNTGYGIKPPMQGKGMLGDMNCWVDMENVPIGGSGTCDEQWEYFENIKLNNVGDFKAILITKEIEVQDVRISETRGLVDGRKHTRSIPYEAPTDGDFSLILEGCPMLNLYWNRTTEIMPHHSSVAAVSWAMQTENGLDILREKWGHSKESEYQIQNSIESRQQPWTCQACQDHGVCIKGLHPKFSTGEHKKQDGSDATDYCFKKTPPKEMINGKLVINPNNIPEENWPNPSPVRLRKKFTPITVEELKKEIDLLDKKDPNIADHVINIMNKAVRFRDSKKKLLITEYLKGKKLIKVSDLKILKKEAEQSLVEDTVKNLDSDSGVASINGIRYALADGGGYVIIHPDEDGGMSYETLCNFQIVINKDISIFSMMQGTLRELRGYILCNGTKSPFVIQTEDWNQNNKLSAAIAKSAGAGATYEGKHLDRIRVCAGVFGMIHAEKVKSHENHGWDDYLNPTVYRSTDCSVVKEGVVTDEESADLKRQGEAAKLSLGEISKENFTKAIHVIKKDMVKLQHPSITMTVIAHSLQAAIHNVYMESKDAPILWIQGTTGAGKTTIAEIGQRFYGQFDTLLNVSGTGRSLEMMTMAFKDALVVIDDFKEELNRKQMIALIQKIYDRSGRTRLTSNLEQRTAAKCRGLVMVTAEDRPTSEASAIARCIYVEAPGLGADSDESKARLLRVRQHRHLFSGVTARFIHFVMTTYPGTNELHPVLAEINKWLIKDIRGTQNSNRVAKNLAANFLTWSLFCDFMTECGLMSQEEHIEFIEQHKKNVLAIRDKMVIVLGQELASAVFVDTIRELILSGAARIENLTEITEHNRNAKVIGFVTSPNSGEVNLYPQSCIAMAKDMVRRTGSGISHGKESIGKQMQQMGLIKRSSKDRTTTRIMWKGSRAYVWCLDGIAAGLCDPIPSEIVEDNETMESMQEEEMSNVVSLPGLNLNKK